MPTTVNPYLTRLQDRADQLRTSIAGLQTKAANEDRDLTEDELGSIEGMADELRTAAKQIEDLTEIEVTNRTVGEMASRLDANNTPAVAAAAAASDTDHTRSATGGGSTRLAIFTSDRDPGHYRSLQDGGRHSFFADLWASKMSRDEAAEERLTEHMRALDTSVGGGVIPPKWLAQEYEEAARQGRALANAVRRIDIGDDPRPIPLPKQTSTSAVEDQYDENDPVNEEEPGWASDTVTVTPRATAGKQTVSRQLLDMSSPSVDGLIFADLIGDYNEKVEAKVAAAVLAAGQAALPANAGASGVTAADHYNKVAVQAQVKVRLNRKRPADIYALSVSRWGDLLGLTDTTGRPLVPAATAGPMNVAGVGTVAVDGRWHGLGVVSTNAFEPEDVGTPLEDVFAALRAADVLLFESNMLRFRFEEQKGPESIVLGVWAYTATHVKYGGDPVQRVDVSTS